MAVQFPRLPDRAKENYHGTVGRGCWCGWMWSEVNLNINPLEPSLLFSFHFTSILLLLPPHISLLKSVKLVCQSDSDTALIQPHFRHYLAYHKGAKNFISAHSAIQSSFTAASKTLTFSKAILDHSSQINLVCHTLLRVYEPFTAVRLAGSKQSVFCASPSRTRGSVPRVTSQRIQRL